ncbi:FAD-dependent oxidoreductase [bacterium]|nr:FAD-dependent oxidoreductase [bacterium]
MSGYDVVVCGGGTAGSCAAIAAARGGAKTLLVEQFGFLGGSQTGALVVPYMSYHAGGQQLITGMHQEIIDRLAAWPGGCRSSAFNYELLKYVLEDMTLEAGVELLYHTFLAEAVTESGRLTRVVAYNKSGRQEFAARQFVDCTADADIAFRAGVPCESGRPEDGLNQSASLRFVLGNVDLDALAVKITELTDRPCQPPELSMGFSKGFTVAPKIEAIVDQATADGVFAPEEGGYVQFFSIPGRPGEVAFNCPRITFVNGAKAEDLTKVQVQGRKVIPKIMEFCRRYLAGFDDAYLVLTAPLPGIRESRRIVGEYVLTAEDCLQPTRFPDRIAKSSYPVDVHNPSGVGITLKKLPPGEYHDIPYRCLVPLGVDDLLVAGRCISATFEAQAAIRIEPTCRALGEAAGTAAALCLERACTPRALPAEVLLEKLAANGANVSE